MGLKEYLFCLHSTNKIIEQHTDNDRENCMLHVHVYLNMTNYYYLMMIKQLLHNQVKDHFVCTLYQIFQFLLVQNVIGNNFWNSS